MKIGKTITETEATHAEAVSERDTIAPPVDVYENDDELLLIADMPGVSKKDIDLHVDKGLLRLHGRRQSAHEGALIGTEFAGYDFERTFRIPERLDSAHMSAELADGVLRVHLPKSADIRPRRIAVQ